MASKRLGEILVDQGVLKTTDIDRALEIQKKEGGLIGEILVKHGLATEEQIVIALAAQFGYPYLPVSSFVVNPEAVAALRADIAHEYLCIPVDKVGGTLAVVMSDPSNKTAIQHIEKASSCSVKAFVGTFSEIEDAIGRYYKKEITKKKDARLKDILRHASEERARKS